MSELNLLFKPKTVAMIGASANENKWGHIMLKNLIENGYSGNIIPINPKGGEILNKKVYRKISDVKETIDVALCGVPTTALRDVVMDCSKGNLKYLIIFTAGTAEVGHEGLKLQKDLVALANKSGIRIVGPNCMGLLNHSANLNLTGENGPPKGNIALLAQSGNIGFALFHEATRKNIGLSSYISVGNQADIQFHEYMSYLKDDSDTKAIIVYMEGLKNAKEFKRVVNETVKLKPVIVYKAGSSIASKRSALSHTGSMTGDDKVFDGYFKQINVIRLDNCDEMLDIANALVSGTFMTKNRVALVGGGGGHATSLADLTTKYNLDIPELSERTQKKLKEILLKDSVVKNPIDFVGASESSFSVYEKCTRICLEDANIDGVLIYGLYGGYRVDLETEENNYDKSSIKIAEIVNEMKKPVVMHSIYANEGYTAIDKLRENKVPVYDSADMAAKCMGVLYKYGKIRKKISHEKCDKDTPNKKNDKRKRKVEKLLLNRHGFIPENIARAVLQIYDVPLCKVQIVKTNKEIIKIGKKIDYPVVCKILSESIIHKTDIGGVILNIKNENELIKAFNDIMENVSKNDKSASITGVSISPYLNDRKEVIVGFSRDKILGPIVTFGLGGIFVEILKDVSFRVAPLKKYDAYEMIRETKAYKILTGMRGQRSADIESIVNIILKASMLAIDNPGIIEMDLNPIMVSEIGSDVADVRMIVDSEISNGG